jgi:hypothetical protein
MRIEPSRTYSAVCYQSSREDGLSISLISFSLASTVLQAARGGGSGVVSDGSPTHKIDIAIRPEQQKQNNWTKVLIDTLV